MAARFDCLLPFTVDVFLTGVERGEFWDPAELQRGISGVVEQEEKDEVLLCFLKLKLYIIYLKSSRTRLNCFNDQLLELKN